MSGLPAAVRAATERWIEGVVIARSFCPFAAAPYAEDDVLLEALPGALDADLQAVYRRAAQMCDNALPETTLLLAPDAYASFESFLEFQSAAEALLDLEFPGRFVTASFHPAYTFAELDANSPVHRIHRAPYPTLQLLRQRSVAFAKTRHDVAAVLERNRERATELWG